VDLMFIAGFVCGLVTACILWVLFELMFAWLFPDPKEEPRKEFHGKTNDW
jgi:hypothetical protein